MTALDRLYNRCQSLGTVLGHGTLRLWCPKAGVWAAGFDGCAPVEGSSADAALAILDKHLTDQCVTRQKAVTEALAKAPRAPKKEST